MEERSPGQKAADTVATALRKKLKEHSHLERVIAAFGKTLIEQVRWKADLEGLAGVQVHEPNPELFARGIPLSSREQLILLGELWPVAVEKILPGLQEGFPRLGEKLRRLRTDIGDGSFSPDLFLSATYSGQAGRGDEIAHSTGFESDLLVFVLTQLAWPVVAQRSETLFPMVRGLFWNRGYCPICGSFPEISLLRGEEGRRWLRCGFCTAKWPFYRMTCPFCGSRQPDDSEIFLVEGREHERIEACHHCRRYVAGVDLSAFNDEIIPEILSITFMHLDAAVRKEGFQPMKWVAWKNCEKEGRNNYLLRAGTFEARSGSLNSLLQQTGKRT